MKGKPTQKKPDPLFTPPPGRKRCPVCGEISYSSAGIHPQCAQEQADAVRTKRAKPSEKSEKKPSKASGLRPWHRRCPKCRALVHVRKSDCECGFTFG